MLQPASANDFLKLYSKHKGLVEDMPEYWGLKLTGTLFVHEQIARFSPRRVLEAGAGLSRHFHGRYGKTLDYWMADSSGFYDPDRFARSMKMKPDQTFVDTLLGDNHAELEENAFDMTFSVSVMEHVPIENINGVCKDLYRVTRPGGVTVHSIDLHYTMGKEQSTRWHEGLLAAGFEPEKPDEVSTDVDLIMGDRGALMLEPLDVQYLTYTSAKDKWKPLRPVKDRFCTLFVVMQKPG